MKNMSNKDEIESLLTPVEVARCLSVSVDTLAHWRATKKGPKYLKLGSGKTAGVRYTRAALRVFLGEQ